VSEDGKQIATGSGNDKQANEIKTWDAQTGNLKHTMTGHGGLIKSIMFSSDGKKIVSASYDMTVRVWDAVEGKQIHKLAGHTDIVYSAAISAKGEWIVSGGKDRVLRVWNAETGDSLPSLPEKKSEIHSLRFANDDKWIVAGLLDSVTSIAVLDSKSGQVVHRFKYGMGAYVAAASGDLTKIVAAANTDSIKIWDLHNGQETAELIGHTSGAWTVAVSDDAQCVVSGGQDGLVCIWNPDATPETKLSGRFENRKSGAFVGVDQRPVTWNSGLAVRDILTDQMVVNSRFGQSICNMAASGNGLRIGLGTNDGILRIYDCTTWNECRTLAGHSGTISHIALDRHGKQGVAGTRSGEIRVWNIETGEGKSIKQAGEAVTCLAMSDDGRWIVAGCAKYPAVGELSIWNVATGQKKCSLIGHEGTPICLAISTDGKWLVSGSYDRSLKIWDADSGKERYSCRGHFGAATCVAISHDSKWIVSGSHDKSIKLWDVASGQEKLSLKGHASGVVSVAIRQDDNVILSVGDLEHSVKLWVAEP